MKSPRLVVGLCLAAIACSTLAGCAGKSVTKDTLCSDFMKLSQTQRDDAVVRIASELGNPDVVTPLGRPNVEYVCAQAPNMTLGQVIDASRMTAKPTASATTETEPSETANPDEEATATTDPTANAFLWESFKNNDGYTYTWGVQEQPTIEVTSDTANARPGKVNLKVTVTANIFVANTTEERNAPMPQDLGFVAAWKKGSVLCGAFARDHFWSNVPGMENAYCTLPGWVHFEQRELSIGETATASWGRSAELEVDEDAAADAQADLENPDFTGLASPSGEYKGCLVLGADGAHNGAWLAVSSAENKCPKRER